MSVGGNESEREWNASHQAMAVSNVLNDHSIMSHLQSADPLSRDGEGNATPFWFEADKEFGGAETDGEGEWEAEGPENWDHGLPEKAHSLRGQKNIRVGSTCFLSMASPSVSWKTFCGF